MSKDSKQELIGQLIYAARASEAATKAFDAAAFEHLGINHTDGRCLDIIENEGPLTAGRLAELSGLTTAAVTSVLDRLESVGYARRTRDDSDRRRVVVELTPAFARRAQKIWEPVGTEAFAELSKWRIEEIETVIEFFKLSRALNERHVERVKKLR